MLRSNPTKIEYSQETFTNTSNESLESVREDSNFVSAERLFHNFAPLYENDISPFEVFCCEWSGENFWKTLLAS